MYKIFAFGLFVLFAFLFFSFWAVLNFGDVSLEKIVFHLFVPMKNMPTDWMRTIYKPFILTLCFSVFLLFLKPFFLKYKKVSMVIFCSLLVFTVFFIERHFCVYDYISGFLRESSFIQQNYISPADVQITFPEHKRNLIIIQVESLENSVQDLENGGFFDMNYIPRLTQIAKDNISFSHSELLEGAAVLPGTGWTIAGIVAETAGLPLKLYGKEIENSMDMYRVFLPGVISLGDILSENGYKNVFILGTGKEFAGQENYLTLHGSYQIYDKTAIENDYEDKSDREVLEFSKDKITELSKGQQPFSVLIQTYDTHLGGYNPTSCYPVFDEDFKNGYLCTDFLVNDFIKWLKKQDFYTNTTVVILGDHCSHSSIIASQVDVLDHYSISSHHDKNIRRKVYNVFINSEVSPASMHNRKFSTIDMFPTILAAMGAKIEGNRLGLGANLFSDVKTLPEIYGYDYLFQELKKKSDFYNNNLLYKR